MAHGRDAPNYETLLVMRLLDGLALTVLIGLSLALVSASVAPEQRAAAIGILMATDTALYGVTPLVGGWVVETFGWRALFLVTPPIALIALLVTARYATESPHRHEMAFDVLGVALFGAALLGLVAGIGAVPDGNRAARLGAAGHEHARSGRLRAARAPGPAAGPRPSHLQAPSPHGDGAACGRDDQPAGGRSWHGARTAGRGRRRALIAAGRAAVPAGEPP